MILVGMSQVQWLKNNSQASQNNELVDYFVSFLKMLSLKLDESTVQFFYNGKFKDFPLYSVATWLYNHKEPMVRTAAKTITLAVYSIATEEMLETILSLPHATYFVNLASYLRYLWMKIDVSLMKDYNFDDLRDELEDVNDLLMYIQDIFNTGLPKMTRALSNSLLYYAYLPSLLGSLSCADKDPDINSYSATIYFLTQTYNIIKEPMFINALSIALFLTHIPVNYGKYTN